MASPTTTAVRPATKRPNPLSMFKASLERDGLSAKLARFIDPEVERKYTQHLVEKTVPTERILWYLVIFTYFSYAILDVTTITEKLESVLIIRAIFGTIMMLLIPLSFIPKVKPHFGLLSASGLFVSAIGVIWMIAIIPPQGAPPYIIGVLIVFIASSCIMRIPFPVAAAAYLTSSLVYVAVLNLNPSFSSVDIISGHFFMLSIAFVAVITNYTQELRSRTIWLRDEQRQRDSEMIERLLIEATAADQSKINFLSMMSHELRTPLHQIIGYTEVVTNSCKAANDDSDNVQHLNEIHGSAHILLSRIQKMLRFADATAGKMKYEIGNTGVEELVDVSLEQMRTGFDKKDITVKQDNLKDGTIYIDIVHTCYALNNLLENALNASAKGGIIEISGGTDDDGAYELVITDHGRGMSPEQIDKALKPFTQGEHALRRSTEGLGLGLTLATRIFQDQNATIKLESDGTSGTSVTVRFEPPVKAKAPSEDQESIAS
ncbi:sensor histidine kinase [Hyphococcus lacteus]|uniref:histidine kinase n=1 Tax=Hyphococcus lacteus TaxID=3143536 RepID=A0ABV3Z2C9_9PROT